MFYLVILIFGHVLFFYFGDLIYNVSFALLGLFIYSLRFDFIEFIIRCASFLTILKFYLIYFSNKFELYILL